MKTILILTFALLGCRYEPSTPVMIAAAHNDTAAMKRLLDSGTNANAFDDAGYTPLIVAARAGDASMIAFLAARGADPNLADHARSGWTPMLHAIHKGQLASVRALLDAHAAVDTANAEGTTPLMMAAGYGYTDIVELLLARGADRTLKNAKGETALDLAKSGVADIDRFTVFTSQKSTIKALK